jgi:hypothetical protein
VSSAAISAQTNCTEEQTEAEVTPLGGHEVKEADNDNSSNPVVILSIRLDVTRQMFENNLRYH